MAQALADLTASFPSRARLRPTHVSAMRADIEGTGFTLECERDYREYLGPLCVGTITSDGSGSLVSARIRRSRQLWFLPAAILLVAVVGSLNHGGPSVSEVLILAIGLPVMMGMSFLMSLFSTPNHEAEADAFAALLRQAVELADGGGAAWRRSVGAN